MEVSHTILSNMHIQSTYVFFLMNKFLHVYFTLEKIPIWFEETDKSVKLIVFVFENSIRHTCTYSTSLHTCKLIFFY